MPKWMELLIMFGIISTVLVVYNSYKDNSKYVPVDSLNEIHEDYHRMLIDSVKTHNMLENVNNNNLVGLKPCNVSVECDLFDE